MMKVTAASDAFGWSKARLSQSLLGGRRAHRDETPVLEVVGGRSPRRETDELLDLGIRQLVRAIEQIGGAALLDEGDHGILHVIQTFGTEAGWQIRNSPLDDNVPAPQIRIH